MSDNTESVAIELVARDEQQVGIFFSALAIQYFLHRDMLSTKIISPSFVSLFSDVDTKASQRIFIKELIHNEKFSKVIEDLQILFLEYCGNPKKNPQPYQAFLGRINKAFLIRQIFNHSNQVLEKYAFIEDFLGLQQIDLDRLNAKMWHFPIEQQILILARVYASVNDPLENKVKTIGESYKENVTRFVSEVNKYPNKYQIIQVENLKGFMSDLQSQQ